MRGGLIAYWVVSAVATVWAIVSGYPSIGALLALAVGLPWNILLGIILACVIVFISMALESIGAGRIDLSSTSGNQQALFVIVLGSLFGVPLNSFFVSRYRRGNDSGSKSDGPK